MTRQATRSGKYTAFLLLLVAILTAVFIVWRVDTSPSTDDAYAYADTISVAPEVSGRIVSFAVKENQAVKQGDVLFRLDPRPFQETLNKAQAGLVALNKEIEIAQRLVDAQQYNAKAVKSNVEHARAAARQANDTLTRIAPLLGDGYVAAEQIDQAKTAKRMAEAQLASALDAAQSANSGITSVDALVAKRAVMQADIALAALQLEYATVTAPFDGRVVGLETTVGQFAAAGHPLFMLVDTGHWYVVANFRETDLQHIRPGMSAQVYLMADTGKRFAATVASIGYGVHPDDGGTTVFGLPLIKRSINWVHVAQRFPVRFQVQDPDPALFRIGASAIAQVTGDIPPTSTQP